jgi:hypothetical protein
MGIPFVASEATIWIPAVILSLRPADGAVKFIGSLTDLARQSFIVPESVLVLGTLTDRALLAFTVVSAGLAGSVARMAFLVNWVSGVLVITIFALDCTFLGFWV